MGEVEAGQVWADRDSREAGRTVRVDRVDSGFVYATVLTASTPRGKTGHKTRVRLSLFPRSYRPVPEGADVYPAGTVKVERESAGVTVWLKVPCVEGASQDPVWLCVASDFPNWVGKLQPVDCGVEDCPTAPDLALAMAQVRVVARELGVTP